LIYLPNQTWHFGSDRFSIARRRKAEKGNAPIENKYRCPAGGPRRIGGGEGRDTMNGYAKSKAGGMPR
jgi:hypothetical protein